MLFCNYTIYKRKFFLTVIIAINWCFDHPVDYVDIIVLCQEDDDDDDGDAHHPADQDNEDATKLSQRELSACASRVLVASPAWRPFEVFSRYKRTKVKNFVPTRRGLPSFFTASIWSNNDH